MTTPQIVIFIILSVLHIVGFYGVVYTKKEHYKIFFEFLIIFSSALFFCIGMVCTVEMNELKKELKDKCPEYEKLDNVYKLK